MRDLAWLLFVGCGRLQFDGSGDAAHDGDPATTDARMCTTADVRYDAWGSGTANDPYRLCSAGQWIDLANHPEAWGAAIQLAADIDLGAIAGDHLPIGTMTMPFTGGMDGGGHVVIGYRNQSGASYLGLFGYVGAGATIHDLAVRDVDVLSSEEAGGLIGYLGASTVQRVASFGPGCYVRSTGYANHKGGLIGETATGAIVEDVFSNCRLGGRGNGVAGLIGHNDGTLARGYYEHSTDPVTGSGKAGGLIGWNFQNAAVSDTFVSSDVEGSEPSTDVALHIGVESGMDTGSYFDSQRMVTNIDAGGGTTTNGIAVDTVSAPGYFFEAGNLPMSRWDFTTVWKARPGAYPILGYLDGKI